MNEQLIQFIELCLVDGVITDKEREVIFRKSKELGVPDDECDIILEGMIQKHHLKKPNPSHNEMDSNQKEVKPVESLTPKSKRKPRPEKLDVSKEEIRKTKIKNSDDDNLKSRESIELDPHDILYLDNELLEGLSKYLNSINENLTNTIDPTNLNNIFKSWYKGLKKRLFEGELIIREYPYRIEYRNIYHKNKFGVETEWIDFEFVDEEGYELDKHNVIGIYKTKQRGLLNYSRRVPTLYTQEKIYDVIITEKEKFFGPNVIQWDLKEVISLDTINILDFNESNFERLYFLMMVFIEDNSVFKKFVDNLKKPLDLPFNNDTILELLTHKNLHGTDLVIKMINYISKIIENLKSNVESTDYYDLTPLSVGNMKYGYNPKFLLFFEFLEYNIKYLSSLISMRNHLVYSVLKEDKISIMIISEELDNLGILLTHYEQQVLKKIDKSNELLKEGFYELSSSLDKISNQLGSISKNLNDGNQQIKERLEFNNLVTVIQTYQMYKINQNTKGLKS